MCEISQITKKEEPCTRHDAFSHAGTGWVSCRMTMSQHISQLLYGITKVSAFFPTPFHAPRCAGTSRASRRSSKKRDTISTMVWPGIKPGPPETVVYKLSRNSTTECFAEDQRCEISLMRHPVCGNSQR